MSDEPNGMRRTLWGVAGVVLSGLVLQTGALLWWAGGMDARMTAAELRAASSEKRAAASESRAAASEQRIQAVEGRLMGMNRE